MNDLKRTISCFSGCILTVLIILTMLTYYDKSEDTFLVIFIGLIVFSIFMISTLVFLYLKFEESRVMTLDNLNNKVQNINNYDEFELKIKSKKGNQIK